MGLRKCTYEFGKSNLFKTLCMIKKLKISAKKNLEIKTNCPLLFS